MIKVTVFYNDGTNASFESTQEAIHNAIVSYKTLAGYIFPNAFFQADKILRIEYFDETKISEKQREDSTELGEG